MVQFNYTTETHHQNVDCRSMTWFEFMRDCGAAVRQQQY